MSVESHTKNTAPPSGCAPETEKPYDLRKEINGMAKHVVKYHEYNSDFDMEIDDLITLNGFGVATEWRYPKDITNCLSPSCGLQFKSRSAAINHYREQHAAHFSLCSICVKPVSARNFIRHHKKMHPDSEVPTFVIGDINHSMNELIHEQEVNEFDNNHKRTGSGDNLITLSGCGVQTFWRFPKGQTRCPVHQCNFISNSNSKLIAHYKVKHAKRAILCDICNKPISSHEKTKFQNHFRRMHPNVKVPYGLGNGMVGKTKRRRVINFTSESKRNKKAIIKGKRKQCEYCSNILLTKNYARNLREVHDLEIRCPSKDCEYTAKQMFLIHQHWSYEHPFLQFPDIRKGTAFIYKRSLRRSPSNNNQKDVRQEVSALSAEDSLLAPLPYQATGSGFLSELSDLESDDESTFFDMTEKATPPETNGNASVAMNQSISDEISPEVRSTQLELIAQSNSQKPADVQAKSMLQVTRVFSIPESTFELNAENDDIVSISDDKTNGEEQQTQADIERSVSPNQRVRQSGSMVQHAEMDTFPRPAVETDIISISDDEESVIDISDDTDEDGTTNAVEQVSKRAHISALQVLYMFQEVDPPIEVQDDGEGSLIEQQPQQRVNDELDENFPAPETIEIPQAAIDGNDDTMNDDFDWSLLQD